jgi:hypothetical protein
MIKTFFDIFESGSGIHQLQEYLQNPDVIENFFLFEKYTDFFSLKINIQTMINSYEFLTSIEIETYVNVLIEKYFMCFMFENNSEYLFLEILFEKKGNYFLKYK